MHLSKILLVDDEPDIRVVAEMSLSMVGGWQVAQASSGPEALAAVEREQPQLILLDVMMPGMDGPETLRALRASGSKVPVVFMTAKVQTHEVEGYLELGAEGVISKPFDPMSLPGQVRTIAEAL